MIPRLKIFLPLGLSFFLAALTFAQTPETKSSDLQQALSSLPQKPRIVFYSSEIDVAKDGKMTVTSTVHIAINNFRLNEKLHRDFLTRDLKGGVRRISMPLKVLSVELDGKPASHSFEHDRECSTLMIAPKETRFVTNKNELEAHVYKITYETDRNIYDLETLDELRWNVTGNSWLFPSFSGIVTLLKSIG